jgi:hypothetical protein
MSDVSRSYRLSLVPMSSIVTTASDGHISDVPTEPPALRVEALIDMRAAAHEVTKDGRVAPLLPQDERHRTEVTVAHVAVMDLIDGVIE